MVEKVDAKEKADEKDKTRKPDLVDVESLRSLRFRAVKLVMTEGNAEDKKSPFGKADEIVKYIYGGLK